jgi:hypothetical protein
MEGSSFIIRVEKVKAGSTVPVGLSSMPLRARVLIGRATHADFQLSDPTVASEHLLLETTREGFSVRVLTPRGTTFVNSARAMHHDLVLIRNDRAWLQIGRVLLSATQVLATLPFEDQLSIPAEDIARPAGAWLTLQGGAEPKVWVCGEPLALFPSALRVLGKLAASPGEVVAAEALRQAMDPEGHHLAGGTNLTQAITYIRNMFDEALARGLLGEEDLRAQVRYAPLAPPLEEEPTDRRQLLRALVQSERGVGYRLRLSPAAISAPALAR